MSEEHSIRKNVDDREDWTSSSVPDGGDTREAPTSTSFCVDSPESANWLIRKVKEARDYAARVQSWAESEVQRAVKEESRLLDRFGHQLRQWVEAELVRNHRRRSLSLPAGTVGLRMQPAQIRVVDEPALISWCERTLVDALRVQVWATGSDAARLLTWASQQCPNLRCTEGVAKAVVNAHVARTGEIPAGVELEDARDEMYLK
jgi:hypothetical protein